MYIQIFLYTHTICFVGTSFLRQLYYQCAPGPRNGQDASVARGTKGLLFIGGDLGTWNILTCLRLVVENKGIHHVGVIRGMFFPYSLLSTSKLICTDVGPASYLRCENGNQ